MAKSERKLMEPIDSDKQEEWDFLISRSRAALIDNDDSNWRLIILAAEVEAEYGKEKIKRWAEEIGMGYTKARTLKSLANKGIDQAFVNEWCRTTDRPNGLSYGVIRAIAQFNRSLNSPIAQHHLTYAMEHQLTVAGISGYMYQIEAPYDHKTQAERSIKQAVKDKQEHEGFGDYIAVQLEQMIEEQPEAEDFILATRITSEEDFRELEIKAGVREDLENNQVDFSRRTIDKMKRYRKAMQEIQHECRTSITTGHELSEELRDAIKYLRDACNFILEARVPDFSHLDEHDHTFDLSA